MLFNFVHLLKMKYLFYTFLVYGNYYMEIKRLNDSKPANYGFIILIIAKSTTNNNIQDGF